MDNYRFLLGVKDPEMDMIENILIKEKMCYQYALHNGEPVNLGNAYKADQIETKDNETLVLIECEPLSLNQNLNKIIYIDHHREGDFGHNLPAEKYWEASSIGQLHKLLNIKPTQKALNIAAFDHCFRSAIHGKCLNINPEDILDMKINEISKTTGLSAYDIQQKLLKYKDIIYSKESIKHRFVSITDIDTGHGYSAAYLIFQLLAVLENITVLFKHKDTINGKYKIIYYSFDKEKIKHFIEKHKNDPRFENVYGSPERGYAGAYYINNNIK